MSNSDTTPEVSQVETSQVSEEQTPVVEDQDSNEQTEVDTEIATQETSETQESGEGQQQNEEERKPSRAERRLHQLLEKGKKDESPLSDLLASMPDPEPDEYGYYTPQQVKQMAATEAIRAIELERGIQSYKQNTETFISEIEEVGEQILEDFKENPKLAETVNKILSSQLQAANLRTDERGRQFLVPIQKPSQLYKEIKEALEMTSSAGTERATAALARQVAESAITPGATHSSNGETLSDLKKQLWENPGKVAKILESRLPRSND